MKSRLATAIIALSALLSTIAHAQFVPGQLLTASQLSSAFARVIPIAGGTMTGPLAVPSLSVTTPIPIASGGTGAATALAATGQLQFQSPAAGSTARTVADKLGDVVNFRDYGGKCDGTTNDDAAMTTALASLVPGESLVFPAGTCLFSTPKVLPIVQNVSIRGAGARQTAITYTGTNTTSDLWTIGDGTTSMTGWSITGLRFDSTTTMTGGAALHLRRMQNGSELYDVDAGVFGQASRNLYNGIWLDNVNIFKYTRFNIQVQNDGLRINGSATSDEGSDVFLDDGAITFSNRGYHVGGGQGGIYFGKVLAYGNGINFLIDNALAARLNREIFFSDQAVSDGSYSYGVYINDALTSNAPIVMNGAFGSSGVISGAPNVPEIYVQKWPNGRITLGPGQLYNATGDGLRVDDASTIITIDSARHIFNNGGYGVNATVPTTNISSLSQYTASNVSGAYSPNVTLGGLNVGGTISGTTLTNTAQTIDKAYTYTAPASGSTVTIASGTQTALIAPSATIAALTVTLPACTTAYDGSLVRFATTQAITTLTVNATSGTVSTPGTTMSAGSGRAFLCRGANTTWYSLR